MVIVIASAVAQDALCLLESTHKFQVPLQAGNTYQWKVYTVQNWTDVKDADLASIVDFNFSSSESKNFVNIEFLRQGKYYVIVEEFNPSMCSTRRAFGVEVEYGKANIQFQYLISSDCSDDDNSYSTALISYSDEGVELPESHYPLTISYSVNESEIKTAKINFVDKLLHVEGIIEDKTKETINKIQIISAKNKYGGKLFLTKDKNLHARKIFKKPTISKIMF